MTESQSLLTVPQVAQLLQLSSRSLWKVVKRGDLPTVRLGRLVRIDPQDLADYLQRCKTGGPVERES